MRSAWLNRSFRVAEVLAASFVVATSALAQGSGTAGDTLTAGRQRLLQIVRTAIAGREMQPAESVFKDIQILRGMPANRVLAIMDQGFSRSLGVGCGHCHVTSDFARGDSVTKSITRDMWAMMQRISTELLPLIKGLRGASPAVNCTTCHRGQVRPATSLPPPV